MGLAATAAKLLASLDLDTKPFEAGARRVGASLGKMESRFSKLGGIAQRGVGTAVGNIAKLGVVAAGAIAVAVRSGIQSLADLERVQNATAGVIESTGGAAGVTAVQIRAMAESLEAITTADDKVIQGGQNLLLTFTGIGKNVFPQATKAMVDMGIAMAQGDVANADFKTSAIQIGKALNDPVRGITALRRVGVAFTKDQEKQIKKLVESGDVLGAQKIILKELEVEFGKAGEAAGKGFGGDLRRLDDAFEDTRMALATGFLPVIRKVADKLSTELVKPEVQRQIMDFGVTLAGAFDKLLSIGGKLPWAQIGDSLRIAGAGAKALFDAFTMLPPWVQTAVLTGWGLNKLSGGMLTGLVGELGKGLIKGVLGMNAGVVNARAGVVNVAGGVGGGPGAIVPGGKTGGLSVLSKVFLVGEAIGLVLAVKEIGEHIGAERTKQAQEVRAVLQESLAGPQTMAQLQTKLAAIDTGIAALPTDPLGGLVTSGAIAELKLMRAEVVAAIAARSTPARDNQHADAQKATQAKLDKLRASAEANRIATVTKISALNATSLAQKAAVERVRTSAESNRIALVSTQRSVGSSIVAAIKGIQRPIISVSVTGNVIRTTYQSGATLTRSIRPGILALT